MQRYILAVVAALFLMVPALSHAQEVVVPGIRVGVAPPPPRVEVRPMAPSPRHIWIGGHWGWRGGAHAWLPGHYALPPGAGYHWVDARWVPEGGRYVYFEGHWAMNQPRESSYVYDPGPAPVQEVVVQQAPPPEIVEVRPVAPFGGAVWIGGYWHWNGVRHTWVGGHWSAPRAGYAWEGPRWERGPRGWVHHPGHWRR